MINKLLMTPGPTNVPERVLNEMSRAMIHHRTDHYGKIFGELNEKLKYIFQTKNEVLTFPSAGTGGLEASIVNMFSKGDKILAVTIGNFGDRFIKIAQIYGIEVDIIKIPWGKCVEVQEIKRRLTSEHKGLYVTHNETSSTVVNPIKEIGEFMKDKEQVYIVDAVSSLGGIEIKMDQWNIDVLVTASQKALMCPPGLSFVGVSEKGFDMCKRSNLPKFYWDFQRAREFLQKSTPQNPYTPAISLIVAANEAISMIEEEGLENTFKRHSFFADKVRMGCEEIGFKLFADENCRSNTVTGIIFEDSVTAPRIKEEMDSKFNIIIAGGQGDFKNKMIRIGHMGCVNEDMVNMTLDSLKKII